MKPTNGQISWFALFVRTKHERIIEKALNDKGYETYVPYRAVERKRADRIKLAHVPLFPNCVFCRFNPADRFPVVSTPDVYSVICLGKTTDADTRGRNGRCSTGCSLVEEHDRNVNHRTGRTGGCCPARSPDCGDRSYGLCCNGV